MTVGPEALKSQRLNRVIDRLIRGEPVLSTSTVPNGNFQDFIAIAQSDYDMVMIETEHQGFDFTGLHHSLHYLLDRRRIAEGRSLQAQPTPFVRIPSNAREQNQWVIKQTLDAGAYGLVLPHLDSVEGAMAAVSAARYPAARGKTPQGPAGVRGWSPFTAPPYWGLGVREYIDRAGVWPLDPEGEILLMGIVESIQGILVLPEVLRQVKGIGAIWAGQGDLSVSMGLRGQLEHPEVEEAVQKILATCKEQGVACATLATPSCGVEKRLEQGFEIVIVPVTRSFDQLQRGLRTLGRA